MHFDKILPTVFGAFFAHHNIFRRYGVAGLGNFLQPGLVIETLFAPTGFIERAGEKPLGQKPSRLETAVTEHGTQQSFQGVGHQALLFCRRCDPLPPEQQKPAQLQTPGHQGQAFFTDHFGTNAGELPFLGLGMTLKHKATDHQVENRIAEKFKSFVTGRLSAGLFVAV